jgi:hypothetical protein
MPLVEFERARAREQMEGEDDGIGVNEAHTKVAINPLYVSGVVESMTDPNNCIIKGPDGRGFIVRSTYADALAKLRAGGLRAVDDEEPLRVAN